MMIATILLIFVVGFSLTRRFNSEMSWISKALMDDKEHKNMKDQARFYDFIQWAISEGIIRKGMTKEEIRSGIEKHIKEDADVFPSVKRDYGWLEYRKNLWFDGKEDDYKIAIMGYGNGIPTPELILIMKDGKLARWQGLGAEAAAKAARIQKGATLSEAA